ncbi:hypothetical protein ACH4A8_22710 [Streptomyces vietnamensis]|uniref:hypothetical protein n=1 Tax=Streptomyces vietnamensis TaxID=362257 RepID=UPI00379135A6
MPEPLGVDLVELSGGGYESPAMTGRPADDRTRAREACFLDLAEDLVRTSPVPLMLTGGITRRATAETVLGSGVAVVGTGTALAVTPDLPDRWKRDREAERQRKPVTRPDKTLASATGMAAVRHRMRRLARGRNPRPGTPAIALLSESRKQRAALRGYRAWPAASRTGGGRGAVARGRGPRTALGHGNFQACPCVPEGDRLDRLTCDAAAACRRRGK